MRNKSDPKARLGMPECLVDTEWTGLRKTPDGAYLGLIGPERDVFERLHAAIVEQVLPPGAKLAEEELAGIYNMSRMRIRRVLLSLSHVRVVTLFAGRGAFVAKPTPSEARAVFQARRLIETAVLAEMEEPATPALIKRLRRNVAAARAATLRGDRPAVVRLSGAFHVELMAGIGNPTIAGILEELVARSSLVITLYQRSGAPVCRDDHHDQLVDHLGKQGFRKASPLMRHHLTEIEASLDLDERPPRPVDLRDVLRPLDIRPASPEAKSAALKPRVAAQDKHQATSGSTSGKRTTNDKHAQMKTSGR